MARHQKKLNPKKDAQLPKDYVNKPTDGKVRFLVMQKNQLNYHLLIPPERVERKIKFFNENNVKFKIL